MRDLTINNPELVSSMEGSISRMSLMSSVEWWLVHQPSILNFSWNPPHTPASSPLFLSLSILTYLFLTLLLTLLPLPPFPPHLLRPITALHNLTLLFLSLLMGLGCALTLLTHTPHLRWAVCFPPQTNPNGPLFFWAYIFYLSKYLELLDTLFIILSRSIRRLSFLHVYHHSTVLLMCYLWLQTSQSLFPIALLTNATVHVIMYAYYFLTGLGFRPSWKRAVTDFQIVQFVFSFAISGLMLHYHFNGSGCSGIWGWCFNAIFNASLLALFLDFHLKSYANRRKRTIDKRNLSKDS